MVLGFSLRKKKSTQDGPAPIRSPSLPDIRAQQMAWPESLVDLPSYRQPGPEHPPPRTSTTGPIASIYARPPPSSFNRQAEPTPRRSSASQRRPRVPVPFNLMVTGPRGVGKSSLLRLLIQMSELPAPLDALPTRPTRDISTLTLEVPHSDRLVLTVIDTPGLDYSDGAELELEKAVTGLVKYIDSQYTETLGEESKVVRQSKGDQHIHLCIYLIDPSSIQSPAQRSQLKPLRTRLSTPESSAEDWDSESDEESSDQTHKLSMLPAEIRAIQRLSQRANLFPVIARGDTLTDARLARIKRVVRRDLANAGVDLKLFGIGDDDDVPQRGRVESRAGFGGEEEPKVIKTKFRRPSRPRASMESNNDTPTAPIDTASVHVVPKVDDSTLSPMFPLVIIAPDVPKVKGSKRQPTADSRTSSIPGTPMAVTTDDPDLPSAELSGSFSPREGAPEQPPPIQTDTAGNLTTPPQPASRSPSMYASPGVLPPSSWRGGAPSTSSASGTRTYPRGQFTRKYRWGTIDVLDPAHCDVGVLRGVILGSHMKALKTHTREVMYERFRTEKLLARRATANISAEQRSRLLNGLDP
ncbi:Septin-9 OS=Homo sapiens GN=SEPT9 PE=1 SV=2 [Rhizoctonia solani AG-1 IB]|uniref:Septin-9 n=1 Tax=Thanatephorus cucumeris (strain AG1-IB / isolate 7/3/14) TaxID=1108050 RepID=A0A0B7FXV2_THACB|nr:Septin-9 OS=Homo sapiens GN=SEPT9 PE=1 SV=2 [Rhizoctonia solani AG-1 IB]